VTLYSFEDTTPSVHPTAFAAPSAQELAQRCLAGFAEA